MSRVHLGISADAPGFWFWYAHIGTEYLKDAAMKRVRRMFSAVVLAATGSVGLVVMGPAGAAQAHTCSAQDPAGACGGCQSGTHQHTSADGTIYCWSSASYGDGGADYAMILE